MSISIFALCILLKHVSLNFCGLQIRPIDKKLQYQVQKLAKAADSAPVKGGLADEKEDNTLQEAEDPLKFRPNPDLLVSKTATDMQVDVCDTCLCFELISYKVSLDILLVN